ncbi:MAG: hypothetical protein ACKOEW_04780 [Methylocystis sp.]
MLFDLISIFLMILLNKTRIGAFCLYTSASITIRSDILDCEVVMSGCEGVTLRGVTRKGWEAIKRSASTYGIHGGDTGRGSSQGFSIAWQYDEGAKTLHIQCVEAPDLIPCTEINSRLRSELQQVIADAGESSENGTMIA